MCDVQPKISPMFYKVIICCFALFHFIISHLMNKLTMLTQVATLLRYDQESNLGDVDERKKQHILHHLNA